VEPIEITVKFDTLGQLTPVSFTWKGRAFPVDSTGRRWEDEMGEHFMVMIPVERVCELVYRAAERRWYVRFSSPGMASFS
jgi:hypothetical protein